MANRSRGEVRLLINGVEYTLRFGLNQLAILQDKLGYDDLQDVLSAVERVIGGTSKRFAEMRAVYWSAFHQHQPDLTEEDVFDLMESIGYEAAQAAIAQAASRAMPDPSSETAGNPPQAQAGNGATSTSTPAPSA